MLREMRDSGPLLENWVISVFITTPKIISLNKEIIFFFLCFIHSLAMQHIASFICNCSIAALICASFSHNSKGKEFRRVSNLVMKLQLFGEIAVWHMLSVINGITLLILKLITLLFASWMTDFSFNEYLLLCTNGMVASSGSDREDSTSLCLVVGAPCEICWKPESQRWNYSLFLSPSNWPVSRWFVSLL